MNGASSKIMGSDVKFNGDFWVYAESGEKASNSNASCVSCGLKSDNGHDPCIRSLPGVANACCGHGVASDAYVQLVGGETYRGDEAMVVIKEIMEV